MIESIKDRLRTQTVVTLVKESSTYPLELIWPRVSQRLTPLLGFPNLPSVCSLWLLVNLKSLWPIPIARVLFLSEGLLYIFWTAQKLWHRKWMGDTLHKSLTEFYKGIKLLTSKHSELQTYHYWAISMISFQRLRRIFVVYIAFDLLAVFNKWLP